MRIALLMIIGLLAGCGSSDDDSNLATTQQVQQAISSIPNEATQIVAMRAEIDSLKTQIKSLTLIGKPTSSVSAQGITPDAFRTMGEIVQAAAAISFGPCTTMGVLIGFENANGQPANANTARAQDFRQCTGYQYGATISDGSITTSERIFWDGPNCTGTILIWEAGDAAYNTSTLKNGVTFASPFDGAILMVKAGQIATPTFFQSVWIRENPSCQADVETQPMYQVTPNDVNISGIPSGGVGPYQLGAP